MKLWQYIRDAMLRRPRQTIGEGTASMTYEEMVIFAECFAQRLRGERCCAILCRSEMAAAMGLLSCFAAGVTAVPLSVRYGEQHCRAILDFIRPTGVITDMDGELRVMSIMEAGYLSPAVHPALIMCTSGTTGTPKGVMLSEDNILTNVKDIASYFAIGQEDAILIARPLYHCAVLTGEFLTALIQGSRILFFSGRFDPQEIGKLLIQNEMTVMGGTPTLWDKLARLPRAMAGHSLQHIVVSGECMSEAVGKRIRQAFGQVRIYHVYGLTEAGPRVSYLDPALFDEFPHCVGIPLPSVQLEIRKDGGKPARTGEEGILWVKGDSIMLGYYRDPIQTKRVLKNGWLCTGDMAQISARGLLKIKGRSDDLIIRAGMNIYPQEVEAALKQDPRVRDVVVYSKESSRFGTQIGMTIAGDFAGVGEVRQLCAARLPSFQVPSWIELVEELPKNGSGKVIRRSGQCLQQKKASC